MCQAEHLSYNYDLHEGMLLLPDYHCVDMTGCIALFCVIDSLVQRITTVEGVTGMTIYERDGEFNWRSSHAQVPERIRALTAEQPRVDGGAEAGTQAEPRSGPRLVKEDRTH
jgi:hypothetical protein